MVAADSVTLIVTVEIPALGLQELLSYDLRLGQVERDRLMDRICEMVLELTAELQERQLDANLEYSADVEARLDTLRSKALHQVEDWRAKLRAGEEAVQKLEKAKLTMNGMRESYLKEVMQLREQLFRKARAEQACQEFEPDDICIFDPTEFPLDGDLVVLQQKAAMLQQRYDAERGRLAEQLAEKASKMETMRMLIERKDMLLRFLMKEHSYKDELAIEKKQAAAEPDPHLTHPHVKVVLQRDGSSSTIGSGRLLSEVVGHTATTQSRMGMTGTARVAREASVRAMGFLGAAARIVATPFKVKRSSSSAAADPSDVECAGSGMGQHQSRKDSRPGWRSRSGMLRRKVVPGGEAPYEPTVGCNDVVTDTALAEEEGPAPPPPPPADAGCGGWRRKAPCSLADGAAQTELGGEEVEEALACLHANCEDLLGESSPARRASEPERGSRGSSAVRVAGGGQSPPAGRSVTDPADLRQHLHGPPPGRSASISAAVPGVANLLQKHGVSLEGVPDLDEEHTPGSDGAVRGRHGPGAPRKRPARAGPGASTPRSNHSNHSQGTQGSQGDVPGILSVVPASSASILSVVPLSSRSAPAGAPAAVLRRGSTNASLASSSPTVASSTEQGCSKEVMDRRKAASTGGGLGLPGLSSLRAVPTGRHHRHSQ